MSFLSKYCGYFHDGTIYKIEHFNKSIIFEIESAEIREDWEWNRKQFPLSNRATVSGKLYLEGIKKIEKNNKPLLSQLKMEFEDAELFDIEIHNNKIKLLIIWHQYLPKKISTDIISIEIEAEKIYWENIPELSDQYWKK